MSTKIPVTAQQRANAIEARDVMWASVPPENVTEKLWHWRAREFNTDPPNCGSLACFGGWTEHWPPFREQLGMKPGVSIPWRRLANLFGPPDETGIDGLFAIRTRHYADAGFNGTDHELVTNRLNWLIENSEVRG